MAQRQAGLEQAKRPHTPFAGTYGHPVHPLVVTVPIGAWVASLVFDVVALTGDAPDAFAVGAYWLIGIGLLGALAAAAFGLLDLLGIPRGTRAFRTGLLHMSINLGVVALFAVNFFMRRAEGAVYEVNASMIALSAVALGMLAGSGWLGGKLTYRFGVRVVDQETQADGYRKAA